MFLTSRCSSSLYEEPEFLAGDEALAVLMSAIVCLGIEAF